MEYTKEQKNIINYFKNNKEMLLVEAGAGCGKTSTALAVVDALNPDNGLYMAFNKAIVKEGTKRFSHTNVESKTFHALAWKYTNPGKDIQSLSYGCITENILYMDKRAVIDSINKFFLSSSVCMESYLNNFFKDNYKLKDIAISYIQKMIDKKIPCTFDFMLKYFHLMLHEGYECKYDVVILDEINDVTAVTLEIFKLIKAPVKLGLGESNQAIYHFLDLKNGFEELKNANTLPLTKSFRCSKDIAYNIQTFLKTHINSNSVFIGTDKPFSDGKLLHVTLTNASIIYEVYDCIKLNKRFKLLRSISEIFAYPMAIITASSGKKIYQNKYKFLEKEYLNFKKITKPNKISFFSFLVSSISDDETKSAIALLSKLKSEGINLFDLYNKAKKVKSDSSYTIATVFTAKGLEFETVYINDDLNRAVKKILTNGGIQSIEDLTVFRCYYVACSRAGINLQNSIYLN